MQVATRAPAAQRGRGIRLRLFSLSFFGSVCQVILRLAVCIFVFVPLRLFLYLGVILVYTLDLFFSNPTCYSTLQDIFQGCFLFFCLFFFFLKPCIQQVSLRKSVVLKYHVQATLLGNNILAFFCFCFFSHNPSCHRLIPDFFHPSNPSKQICARC